MNKLPVANLVLNLTIDSTQRYSYPIARVVPGNLGNAAIQTDENGTANITFQVSMPITQLCPSSRGRTAEYTRSTFTLRWTTR